MTATVRVLFVSESVTLAHVVRLVTLAKSLPPSRFEVHLASDSRYWSTLGELPFRMHQIESMPAAKFEEAISTGETIFDEDTLTRYLEVDRDLIEGLRPNIVVGDFRLSLGVSTRLHKIPYINLTNAYWSPSCSVRQVVPEYEAVKVVGAFLGQIFFNMLKRQGLARHVAPVNSLRRKHGLAVLPEDFRWALTDGDLTLFSDVPAVVPIPNPRPHERFIGPVPWSPPCSLPSWWSEFEAMAARKLPVIYLTLGSSGPPELLPEIVKMLGVLEAIVVVSTAGRIEIETSGRVFSAPLLPGDRIAELASVIICNGGSPTAYQGLAAGRPVVGLATNMDQFLNMAAIEDAGGGVLLRSKSTSARRLQEAVRSILKSSSYRENVSRIQDDIVRHPWQTRFHDAIHYLLSPL